LSSGSTKMNNVTVLIVRMFKEQDVLTNSDRRKSLIGMWTSTNSVITSAGLQGGTGANSKWWI
jgi:hypothetical protein